MIFNVLISMYELNASLSNAKFSFKIKIFFKFTNHQKEISKNTVFECNFKKYFIHLGD